MNISCAKRLTMVHPVIKHWMTYFSSQVTMHEKKISVNNININYVEAGTGSNSVLLMPGALGSAWTDFKPQIESLPKFLPNYQIIAWDPPGYGKSVPPRRKFDLDFFHSDAKTAKDLMVALGKKRFSILGWSDGGITGIILAATFPEAVEKLVVWGSNAYIADSELQIYEGIRDVSKWSQRMREPMEKIYGAKEFQKLWSELVDIFLLIHKERQGDLCKKELAKISCPMLILHGKKDPMLASEHVPFLREHIKHAKYFEFPDGKHNIHVRYPDEFNQEVANFLNG